MKKIVLIGLVGFLLMTFSAIATVVRSMNLSELAQDAQYIVKVKVLDKTTDIDTEESGRIVTYWTFEVLDWVKGTPTTSSELVIKQIGQGQFTVDGYNIQQNLFFPEYEIGKTYVLFLPEAHEKTGMLAPVGLYQGVFEVKTVSGKDYVPQMQQRLRLLKGNLPQTSKFRALGRQLDTVKEDPSYENFKAAIESAQNP